jgi:hypothetical protein
MLRSRINSWASVAMISAHKTLMSVDPFVSTTALERYCESKI